MKLVPVGSSDSNSAFRAGGMNFAVERDQSKIWSSPQGVCNAWIQATLSADSHTLASNSEARWNACLA